MKYTIYETKNLLNGKIYVGKHQTKNLDDGYLGSGKLLIRAIEKHGSENFSKKILYVFDNEEEMDRKEAEIVNEEFVNRSDTYNLCPGGRGGFGYIHENGLNVLIQDQRKLDPLIALRAANAGNDKQRKLRQEDEEWLNEYRSKLSKSMKGHQSFLGKSHSEETKKKIGESISRCQKGKGNSQYGTIWITNGLESKKIKRECTIPKGWYKGRKMKIRSSIV